MVRWHAEQAQLQRGATVHPAAVHPDRARQAGELVLQAALPRGRCVLNPSAHPPACCTTSSASSFFSASASSSRVGQTAKPLCHDDPARGRLVHGAGVILLGGAAQRTCVLVEVRICGGAGWSMARAVDAATTEGRRLAG